MDQIETLWALLYEARADQADRRRQAASLEWRQRPRAAGLQVGEYELDVVGESYRHAALAGIRAALAASERGYELRTVALLEPEPSTPKDPTRYGL